MDIFDFKFRLIQIYSGPMKLDI